MCDSGIEEDVAHFLVGCGEFERVAAGQMSCAELCGLESGWMNFRERTKRERWVVLLLGKGVEGI